MRHSPALLIRPTHTPIIIVALCLLASGQLQAEITPDPAGVSVLLIEALQSDDPYVRQKAALALDRLPPEAATSVLLAALDSDDSFVRQRAAKSLITIAGGAPVEVMRAALQDDDATVRHYAASALDNLGPRTLVPIMSIALESDDPAVRHKAAELLSTQDPNAWQNTWHLLVPAEPAPQVAAPPSFPTQRQTPSPWRSERYLGWEHKWSMSWPYIMDEVMDEEIQLRYNRVEGPFLGWRLSRAYHGKTGLTHFAHGGYGFGAEDWQFQAGGEIYTFYGPPETQSHLATIGAEIHDVADSQDDWLISQEENTLSALLMKRDFLDYYRRFGWSAYTAHNVGGILHMTVKYGRDKFES